MYKYKMLILTHPELASGFKLAGVEVEETTSSQQAYSIINKIITAGGEFGLIALDEDLYNAFEDKTKKKLEERGIPLIIPFPTSNLYKWKGEIERGDYATSLIREAIGYSIKLKR